MISSIQLYALFTVMMMTVGQVMFKVSALSWNDTGSMFAPKTFGLLCLTMLVYVGGAIAWVLVLRRASLGEVVPFVALAYVMVPIASYYLFAEQFAPTYIVGTLLIVIGVTLCARA